MGPTTVQAINAMEPERFLASFTVAKVVLHRHRQPAADQSVFLRLGEPGCELNS